jgi:hypothetical protein
MGFLTISIAPDWISKPFYPWHGGRMTDSPATPPAEPALTAQQWPVAGDEVWIRATFMRVSHDGVYVRIAHPTSVACGLPFQSIVVDPGAVFAPLQIGALLKAYGQ